MNAVTLLQSTVALPSGRPPEPIWRLSLEQYHAMVKQGILTEDTPVELLEGWLVPNMPRNPLHVSVTDLLCDVLLTLQLAGWIVRSQQPITLPTDDSEPEPDVAIVRGSRRDYFQRHPGPGDIGVVIEIADASLARDRGLKRTIYARSGIVQYWIVNLIDHTVEVYSEPVIDGDTPEYRQIRTYRRGDSIPLVLDGPGVGAIAVADILPS